MQHTIGRNARCDAVRAFLAPLDGDARLSVVTNALVTRIVFEGARAVGVEYRSGGKAETARAAAAVLVAAGTYNTAKLLMLSGIGPADHLRELGIAVRSDLPGVGENLQDHHEVPVIAATNRAVGYFGEDRGWPMLRNGIQFLAFRTGPVTTTGIEACAFYDPDGGERPIIQLYCAPIVYLDRDVTDLRPTHGVTLTSCLLRPKARGRVWLRSADPNDKPWVDARFFGDPEDLRLTIASIRFARTLLATDPVRSLIRHEILPGADVTDEEALRRYCAKTVKTNYHPVGTARMGREDDRMAVLDTKLRVRGVEALRVIDCAAMPMIPSGNTNAPVMAFANRAVSVIAGETEPPRAHA